MAVKEFPEDQFVIMLTTNGLIKKTRLSEFKNVRKGGILAMTIQKKSELFTAKLTSGKQDVIIGTKLGRALRYWAGNLKHYPLRASRGVAVVSPAHFLETFRQEKDS